MAKTKIEWTDVVWNPVTGCTSVSEGCQNCYARTMACRLQAMGTPGYENGFEVTLHPERLGEPLKWKKSKRIFVCSMSDLFHEEVPDEFIWQVFHKICWGNRRHTYMFLTKRPEKMKQWFEKYKDKFWHYHAPNEPQRHYVSAPWPDPCIWLGVSVENQKQADKRIPILLSIPAAKRFVSVEPMLEIINFTIDYDCINLLEEGIDWVICGCESGKKRQPFDYAWARNLKNQCVSAGIPFFLKQGIEGNKLEKMPELDGQVWNQIPEG